MLPTVLSVGTSEESFSIFSAPSNSVVEGSSDSPFQPFLFRMSKPIFFSLSLQENLIQLFSGNNVPSESLPETKMLLLFYGVQVHSSQGLGGYMGYELSLLKDLWGSNPLCVSSLMSLLAVWLFHSLLFESLQYFFNDSCALCLPTCFMNFCSMSNCSKQGKNSNYKKIQDMELEFCCVRTPDCPRASKKTFSFIEDF